MAKYYELIKYCSVVYIKTNRLGDIEKHLIKKFNPPMNINGVPYNLHHNRLNNNNIYCDKDWVNQTLESIKNR